MSKTRVRRFARFVSGSIEDLPAGLKERKVGPAVAIIGIAAGLMSAPTDLQWIGFTMVGMLAILVQEAWLHWKELSSIKHALRDLGGDVDDVALLIKPTHDSHIRVVQFSPLLAYLPAYLADDREYFKQEGIDVKWENAGNDSEVAARIASAAEPIVGLCDPAMVYLSHFSRASSQGLYVLTPLVVDVPTWPISIKEDLILGHPRELAREITIASYPRPSTTYIMAENLRNKLAGFVGADRIRINEIDDHLERQDVLRRVIEENDIVLLWEPHCSFALKSIKRARILAAFDGEGIDQGPWLPPAMYSAVLVPRWFAERRRVVLQRFLRAIARASVSLRAVGSASLMPTLRTHLTERFSSAIYAEALDRMQKAFCFLDQPADLSGASRTWDDLLFENLLLRKGATEMVEDEDIRGQLGGRRTISGDKPKPVQRCVCEFCLAWELVKGQYNVRNRWSLLPEIPKGGDSGNAASSQWDRSPRPWPGS